MPQNQDQIFGERPVMASRGGESSARFAEGVALRKSGRLGEAKAAFREVAGGPRGAEDAEARREACGELR